MKFEIGDRVWVVGSEPGSPFPQGKFAGVVVGKRFDPYYPYAVDVPECFYNGHDGYPPTWWICRSTDLFPRDDPDAQKREELGSWDLCPWRPERVTVSEEASHD